MTGEEWDFLNDQRTERLMYCEHFVDRKWNKTMQRIRMYLEAIERMCEKAVQHKVRSEQTVCFSDLSGYEDNEIEIGDEFQPSESSEDQQSSLHVKKPKRRKVLFEQIPKRDNLPQPYRHIRVSIRKVCPEVYENIDKLKIKKLFSYESKSG
ncbi:hypothetical protein SNE40_019123 [Patella caerulea]|uniref:Uncharacterized protein n=1 Tax=Patella caerulea TaxID=87958 RepID=A0AAN8J631_PATCE